MVEGRRREAGEGGGQPTSMARVKRRIMDLVEPSWRKSSMRSKESRDTADVIELSLNSRVSLMKRSSRNDLTILRSGASPGASETRRSMSAKGMPEATSRKNHDST